VQLSPQLSRQASDVFDQEYADLTILLCHGLACREPVCSALPDRGRHGVMP